MPNVVSSSERGSSASSDIFTVESFRKALISPLGTRKLTFHRLCSATSQNADAEEIMSLLRVSLHAACRTPHAGIDCVFSQGSCNLFQGP